MVTISATHGYKHPYSFFIEVSFCQYLLLSLLCYKVLGAYKGYLRNKESRKTLQIPPLKYRHARFGTISFQT